MPSAAKLSITLPAKQAASVRKAVKSGAFASDNEVIIDALRAWEDETEYLRKAWEDGLASGTAGEWDVEEFLRKARERKAKRTSSKRPTKAR
jgi:antitoxin ParD1/3/4